LSEHVRGTQATFTANFLEYDGTPMVPADRDSWPAVTIRDPDNTVIATGIGSQIAEGQYSFNWFVPVAAELSTEDGNNWTIEWAMVTAAGHTHQTAEKFQIVDKIESVPEERTHTYLTTDGGIIRALIRWPRQLCEVSQTVMDATGSNALLYVPGVASNDTQSTISNPNRLITELQQDGEYLYFYDYGPMVAGEYQFHWNTLESAASERIVQVQIGRAVPGIFWHYNAEIRTRVDKLQKSTDMVQQYSDAEVFSYLKGGLDILNFMAPPTNYVLADIPFVGSSGVRTALIYCSLVDAINAQQILEIDLNFDHSGQTVTLNYNHDYSGVLSNLQAVIDKFAEAKIQLFRRSQGAAFSGARVKNFRFGHRVFKLDQAFRNVALPGGSSLWRNLGV